MGTFRVCGIELEAHTVESAAHRVLDRTLARLPTSVHLCNADVLSRCSADDAYREAISAGDLHFSDGAAVVRTAHQLGLGTAQRVPGADLFLEVARQGVEHGLRHYLYGSTDEVLAALVDGLRASIPGVDIVAVESPPFRDLDEGELDEVVHRFEASGAHIVWIGLGTPRQDLLIQRLRARSDATFVAVGAAFDFVGGSKQRAPVIMQRLGLEWVHRLFSEPGRLWRRYLVGNLRYLRQARATAELLGVDHEVVADVAASFAPPARSTGNRITRMLVLADLGTVGLAALLSYVLRVQLDPVLGPLETELPVALGFVPLWLVVLYLFGCYRPEFQNQTSEAVRRYLGGVAVAVLVIGFASFALVLDLSRLFVLSLTGLAFLFGAIVRAVARRYLRRARAGGRFVRRVLIVGADDEARAVADAMLRAPASGYEVVGYVVAPGTHVEGPLRRPVLGDTDAILDLAREHAADLCVVSPSAVPAGTLQELTVALEDSNVGLAVAPSLFEVVTRRVTVESVANVPILHVDRIRLEGWKAAVKRAFDLLVALVLLAVALPIGVVAAVAIKLEDRGPALFVQRRVGRDGGTFRLYKFRTMVVDAEDRLAELASLNEAGHHFFKIRDDPRVTRVGRILRKWSIDELPQIFNVIRGDMSIVGPRPPIPSEVARYEPWHRRRLRIRPGITGVWQVSGRSDVPFDEAVRLDLFYIENWSLAYDVYLVAKTVPAVLGRDGAY